ncbi:MAG: ParB/RepB/Spo0J family partition protein [Clostridia bacterium]|nr:ParB/RepB/Spo0J family partition protein [Clostridia bacterium]
MHTFADKKLLMLRPDDIITNPNQPRKFFDTYELQTLADSISANGIIQPLTVRKTDGGKYALIAGERRLRAAKMVGLRRVPCVLHRTDDSTAALYSLTENMQRRDLNCFEEAEAIERLLKEHRLSQAEIALRLGLASSTVSNKLRLLKLDPQIRERVLSANLTERHARALLRLPAEKRDSTLDKIIAEGLNLAQTEQLIEQQLNPDATPEIMVANEPIRPIRKAAIGDIKLFSNSLSKLLDTMKSSGISANSRKSETEKYIEYKVRIFKNTEKSSEYSQLKIC